MSGLSKPQVAHFEREGYLVVEGLLDPAKDLAPVIGEYETVLDRLSVDLHAAGRIASTYRGLPFGERVTKVYADSGTVHAQYFDFTLPLGYVTDQTPMWTGPAVFATLRNRRILDAVESLIGGEIFSNPIQHIRIKPPEHLTPRDPKTGRLLMPATPWHQDQGVTLEEADDTDMVTVWFGLGEATEANGCLHIRPRSHRGDLLTHCPTGRGLAIPDGLQPSEYLPVPLHPGDVLFMHRRTIHGSLPNRSDEVRWSFDLRYQPTGQPTGRGVYPGFVARSRRDPSSELHDAGEWARLWERAKRDMVARGGTFRVYRWDGSDEACA